MGRHAVTSPKRLLPPRRAAGFVCRPTSGHPGTRQQGDCPMQVLNRLARWFRGPARAASCKKVKTARPSVEELGERIVPAVSFASFANGTWAHNTVGDSWRHISAAVPNAIDR